MSVKFHVSCIKCFVSRVKYHVSSFLGNANMPRDPSAHDTTHLTPDTGKRDTQRGSSLAWNAIFLAAVLLPLMALVIDGARLFYVRGKVQTALDAACEDAAWSGANYRAFRDEGHTQFLKNMAPVIAQARDSFYATIGERRQVNFNAYVYIFPDPAAAAVRCYADASVPLAMYLGEVLSMRVETDAAIRFGK